MGYFIKASENIGVYDAQTSDRISFHNYLVDKGIYIPYSYPTHLLEEKYKDEFVAWLALKRMGVRWWDIL